MENYDFKSETLITREINDEYALIAYKVRHWLLPIIFVCSLILFGMELYYQIAYGFTFGDSPNNAVAFSVFTALYAILLMIFQHRAIKKSYDRLLFTNNGEPPVYHQFFSDKISGYAGKSEPSSFEYDAVKRIYETTNLYLLELQHKLFIVIQKDSLESCCDIPFHQYILEKCTHLKKKKIYNICNSRKQAHIWTILLTVTAIAHLLCRIFYFLPFIYYY